MLSSLKKELLYGSRAVLRDNIWNRRLLARLRSHETLTAEALLALQQKLLHASMQKALVALPYYQHISADFGISEAACVLREAFPLMDKQTLLANPRTLYPHAGKRRPWEAIGKTSGTTGTPLSIWRSPISVAMENAFIKRHWSWSGFHDGMRRATLRGDMVVTLLQATAPYRF
jgi:phenylacetate-CoA ligase